MIKTLQIRVKDKHKTILSKWAYDCNQVWNAVNQETSEYSRIPIPGVGWVYGGQLSSYDLQKQLKGIRQTRKLGILSETFKCVVDEHSTRVRQFKKSKLRWRISSGKRRNLGWVPFKAICIKYINGQIRFNGVFFSLWDSYGLSNYKLKAGSFSEDSKGLWYFNVAVEIENSNTSATKSVGVDLGWKESATTSDGTKLQSRFFRNLQTKLGIAQRAKNKNRVKSIHAKIKNQRKDAIHKFSTDLVKNNAAIFVGNVSSKTMVKLNGKSTLDSGWGMLKRQLQYKSIATGVIYEEINEKYTTQTCSCCGVIPASSPKGRAGLGIRVWTCEECGSTHDRDINAALNILARGHSRLAVESLVV